MPAIDTQTNKNCLFDEIHKKIYGQYRVLLLKVAHFKSDHIWQWPWRQHKNLTQFIGQKRFNNLFKHCVSLIWIWFASSQNIHYSCDVPTHFNFRHECTKMNVNESTQRLSELKWYNSMHNNRQNSNNTLNFALKLLLFARIFFLFSSFFFFSLFFLLFFSFLLTFSYFFLL